MNNISQDCTRANSVSSAQGAWEFNSSRCLFIIYLHKFVHTIFFFSKRRVQRRQNKINNMHNEAVDTGAATMLQPGQSIRPQMSQKTAIGLIESLFGLQVKTIKELNSYDDRNYFITVDSNYDNPHIAEVWPHGYVFKVLNSLDSLKKHVGK